MPIEDQVIKYVCHVCLVVTDKKQFSCVWTRNDFLNVSCLSTVNTKVFCKP